MCDLYEIDIDIIISLGQIILSYTEAYILYIYTVYAGMLYNDDCISINKTHICHSCRIDILLDSK